jgi:LuxR family maltose regulon positive regulatory protein
LRQAYSLCQELQQVVKRLGVPVPLAAYPEFFHAQLAYEWNQLDRAKRAAQEAIEQTAPMQYMDILMGAYEVVVRVCLAQDDLPGAEQALSAMEQVHQSAGIPLFRPWIESLWVQLWLAQGHLTQAVAWSEHAPSREVLLSYSHERTALALVRVSLAQHHYPLALQRLSALLRNAEHVSRGGSIISILALQVAALQASGATPEALRVLHRLLTLTEPEGALRVFLDAGAPMYQALQAWLTKEQELVSSVLVAYARTVCDAFARQQRQEGTEGPIPLVSKARPRLSAPAASPLLEPLTQREQEVLHLLAEGASNQQIANQLVISLTTVKKHVGTLLLKLAAENRTHAVARARELSLL